MTLWKRTIVIILIICDDLYQVINVVDCRSRYTLTVDNVETHERLSSGFMVGTFKRNKFIDFILSLQRHPLFFERTTTLVTTQEKHGSDVKASGWYNLGEWWSWWEEDEDENKLEHNNKEVYKEKTRTTKTKVVTPQEKRGSDVKASRGYNLDEN